MGNDRLGKTVIDELRLCFTAESEFLSTLSMLGYGERIYFDKFSLIRIAGQHFEYYYTLLNEANHIVAYFYHGRYGDDSDYVWVKIENRVLYQHIQLQTLINDIQTTFPLVFNNFTRIDLAKDFAKNTVYAIKRLMRTPGIKTIINGKVKKDRNEIIEGYITTYQSTLTRVKNPSLRICQAEAVNNKTKGVTMQAYNKKAELDNSNKEYILEFYDNPKTLHRLEVRLNSDEIRDYYKKQRQQQTVEDIFDDAFLTDMYYYHLGSVLRFTRGKKPIPWQEILGTAATR